MADAEVDKVSFFGIENAIVSKTVLVEPEVADEAKTVQILGSSSSFEDALLSIFRPYISEVTS